MDQTVARARRAAFPTTRIRHADGQRRFGQPATDRVSASRTAEAGFIIKKGYRYCPGHRYLTTENRFQKCCGTSAIINANCFHLPSTTSNQEAAGCEILANGHTSIESAMARAGTPLQILPFRGAVYVQHGEQATTKLLGDDGRAKLGLRARFGKLRQMRPLTSALRSEFAIRRPMAAGGRS